MSGNSRVLRVGETCRECGRPHPEPGVCFACGGQRASGWAHCDTCRAKFSVEGLAQQNREVHQALARRNSELSTWRSRALEAEKSATNQRAFWIEMLDRARCGCFQRDCRVHGAYAAEDVERVEKARGALAKSEEVPATDLQAEMARPLSYAELDEEHRRMCERMRATEARVGELEGMLRRSAERLAGYRLGCACPGVSCVEDCSTCDATQGLINEIRAALAKPLEHETMCPCNKEGTLGAAFPHAYCQCAALVKKSEGT